MNEELTRSDHGVTLLYDEDERTLTVHFPHEPCPWCDIDLANLVAWCNLRGLLKENMN